MVQKRGIVNRGLLYPLVIAMFSVILVSLVGILYTGHEINQSNQKWCKIIVLLDDTYASTPPTTELGRQIATNFQTLRYDFNCQE